MSSKHVSMTLSENINCVYQYSIKTALDTCYRSIDIWEYNDVCFIFKLETHEQSGLIKSLLILTSVLSSSPVMPLLIVKALYTGGNYCCLAGQMNQNMKSSLLCRWQPSPILAMVSFLHHLTPEYKYFTSSHCLCDFHNQVRIG